MNASSAIAGIVACFESEKRAIPEGRDSTPAPRIVFAKLSIDDDKSDEPPVVAVATALGLLDTFLAMILGELICRRFLFVETELETTFLDKFAETLTTATASRITRVCFMIYV